MKAVRHLKRFRGTFTSSLRATPAPIPADVRRTMSMSPMAIAPA